MKSRYGLEIRAATVADSAGLSALFCTAGLTITPLALAGRLDAIRQDQGAVLIAAEWGPPSGLIILHWYRTLEADRPTAQITTLLVAPDDRRRGIGRLLVKAAAQASRVAGCDAMEIRSPSTASGLEAFCHATGFAEVGSCFVRALRKKG